jgi:dolichol-phosphate mannosyltransferase
MIARWNHHQGNRLVIADYSIEGMNLKETKIYRWFTGIMLRLGVQTEKLEEFLKFAIVGGSGVFVNMGCFFFLTRYAELNIEIASPIAIEISILTNFLLNNIWTFRKRNTRVGLASRIFRYHLVTGLAGLVNYGILLLLAKVFGIHDLVANLIGIMVGMFINFFLNSLWTWRIRTEDL